VIKRVANPVVIGAAHSGPPPEVTAAHWHLHAEPGQSHHAAVGAIAQRCGLWGCATPHQRSGGVPYVAEALVLLTSVYASFIPARPPK
jgi:hypothetical protein